MSEPHKTTLPPPRMTRGRPTARLSTETLVRTTAPGDSGGLVLTLEAAVEGLGLSAWAEGNRPVIDQALHRQGAVLLRGFATPGLSEFQAFARAVSHQLIQYAERSSPRSELGDGVYTSTDHPADQRIVMHTEQSYTLNWPMRLMFFSLVTARQGGNTPLADTRRILARINPGLRQRFQREGVRYVRNYNSGLGLPWQTVFQSDRRADVEEYCRRNDISFQWMGGERLRTWQVRPAVRRHPATGELVWFNHAMFFNVASLDEVGESMMAAVGEDGLPTQTYFGGGGRIERDEVLELRAAYDDESVAFQWRDGDVLVIDNMLTAHGRQAYQGPRNLACSMTDPVVAVASLAATEVAA